LGLSIALDHSGPSRYLPPDAESESRLSIASKVLSFQRPYFESFECEIWKDAPLKSLEGTLLDTISLKNEPSEDYQTLRKALAKFDGPYSFSEKVKFLFKYLGKWKIGEESVDGYMLVSNHGKWRSTYGDIESNVYSTDRFPDLVNLLKSNPIVENKLVKEFLDVFPKQLSQEALKVSRIYFGLGAPSKTEVGNLVGVYYGSDDYFIGDLLDSVTEEETDSVRDALTPYKRTFLIGSLKDVPSFNQFVEHLFTQYHIRKAETGSITLVGRDLDSFELLYSELSQKILKPMAKELPDKDYLFRKIKDVVEARGTAQTHLP